jgi:hypothetical protein
VVGVRAPASAVLRASNKETDERARDSGYGIREAEEPRWNLVHLRSGGNPYAESDGCENDPPPADEKPDGDSANKHGNEDHSVTIGYLLLCLNPLLAELAPAAGRARGGTRGNEPGLSGAHAFRNRPAISCAFFSEPRR